MISYIRSAVILSVLVVFIEFSEGKHLTTGLDECLGKLKLSREDYDARVKNYNHTDPILQCVMACFMENLGRLEGGKLSVDKEYDFVLHRVPSLKGDPSVRDKVATCVHRANLIKDKCEKVHTMMVCTFPFAANHGV